MDDREKKLMQQLDDEMPGVRANALESLREHLNKGGRKFCDLVADLENAVSPAAADELRETLAEHVKLNQAAKRNDAIYRAEIKALKAALWVKGHWKISGAVAGVVVAVAVGGWAYQHYFSRSEAVNAGLRAAVLSATWGDGWGEPVAAKIAGEPYWLMFRGDIDASTYSDNHGNAVEMRCLHLYAAPAEPYSSQFVKPSPRNFLGWVKWPELATHCKPSPNQRADNAK